ncbi:MAG TPA: sugar ABC transporter substrate-binding protein [Bryobacteraceae bacterium]|nr:sugar ABC transporter substrate-binding protein [Bryobacteraceae bacterium]
MDRRKRSVPAYAYSAIAAAVLLLLTLSACSHDSRPTVGVAFETLQTEYWVASRNGIEAELNRRNIRMLEAIADGDANRQLEQVRNFVTRRVDGIIVVPKDAETVIPMVRSANRAGIPIVLFNRPAGPSDTRSVAVVADNFAITRDTVAYLARKALAAAPTHKAAILLGDLSDLNAIARRDGFEAALKPHAGAIETVARIPTDWNQEKALAGMTNALQAHPDISFVFASSDLLLPSIVSALKTAGKYHKTGQPGHVFLAAFDGDATAYRMLKEGYLDADGVQDVNYDTAATVAAVLDLKAGKQLPERVVDPGFVIHQENMASEAKRMWGAQISQ